MLSAVSLEQAGGVQLALSEGEGLPALARYLEGWRVERQAHAHAGGFQVLVALLSGAGQVARVEVSGLAAGVLVEDEQAALQAAPVAGFQFGGPGYGRVDHAER